ncbi:MAG: LysR family transcriptional regulator [Deltaproteobacteria bacterium]|jgi:DNA-binding transcriptional LysR family regulator|nr:LysR family transcriptional regulator [Deltaproteobacteria bacterium]
MHLKRLEIFLKLMDTLSFSKTADAFGLSQPSVSASIKSLEESFGQRLFKRTPRQVKPLPAAEVLAPYAVKIVETTAQAAWAVNRQLADARERLVVGASTVPALVHAPRALTAFGRLHPNVFVKLTSGDSREVTRQVADGRADLGLVGAKPEDESLWAKPFGSDHLVLLTSDRLLESLGRPPVNLNELSRWPLILREPGSGTRDAFMSSVRGQVDSLNFRAEVEGLETSLALVRSSFGAAVISSLIPAAVDLRGLTVVDLDFGVHRTFYLVRRRDALASPATDALITFIERQGLAALGDLSQADEGPPF